jgi:hypothetical protein
MRSSLAGSWSFLKTNLNASADKFAQPTQQRAGSTGERLEHDVAAICNVEESVFEKGSWFNCRMLRQAITGVRAEV